MKYFIIIFYFLAATVTFGRFFIKEKQREGKINDIFNFDIKDNEIYDIQCVEKAEELMTSIQKDYYMSNDISITLKGKVKDIRNRNNNIEIQIIGDTFRSIAFCEFNKESDLISIKREQYISIKGYLKLDGFIKLKDCELV